MRGARLRGAVGDRVVRHCDAQPSPAEGCWGCLAEGASPAWHLPEVKD